MTHDIDSLARHILVLRGRRVMLDRHLAELYNVRPLRLREQVKRNIERFPDDFIFQLTVAEAKTLVSQNAIPSWKHLGGALPYLFTQEGVAMLSGVLRAKLDALEKRYDAQFKVVFDAIRLLLPPPGTAKPVGFRP